MSDPAEIFETIATGRKSARAYVDRPVSRKQVEKLLRLARTAPSGANLQPGHVTALTGAPLARFCEQLCKDIEAGLECHCPYSYFPEPLPGQLKKRQVKVGAQLYEALGVSRKDEEGRRKQFMRNYRFFGAPVGLVISIDRRMGKGCFMDLGMMLQTLLLAAQAEGLSASGIGALANYSEHISALLELPEEQMAVCGVALGFEDKTAPVNQFRTSRIPLEDFTSFKGWET